MEPEARFFAKVEITSECWLWTARLRRGYGQFWFNGRDVQAHCWLWEQKNGPVPKGLELDHLCRQRRCVNPAHLELVTRQENVRRGLAGANSRAKTHCPQGHEYTDENTYHYDGRRFCRECHRRTAREYERRKRQPARFT